jgi:DNA-binding response OmpR family regulator
VAPEGFVVLTAASGTEALALVAREPPDIVLLDVMMPGLDGYQVATALKGDAATRHIPVILLTGLDDYQARTLGSSAGADDFLSRPLDRATTICNTAAIGHRSQTACHLRLRCCRPGWVCRPQPAVPGGDHSQRHSSIH